MILAVAFALAESVDPDFEEGRIAGETRGLPGPALALPADPYASRTVRYTRDDAAYAAAATVLDIDVQFVRSAAEAVGLVYQRRYDTALTRFRALDTAWPTLALGPVGEAIVLQARMFENLDYRHDSAYRNAFSSAKSRLEAGLEVEGTEAPEWFLYGGVLGIDGIYAMRRGEYVTALGRAYGAVNAVAEARKHAPGFVDLAAGDGLYLYWRTVVATLSPVVPRFEDRRAEGIAQLQKVESEGILLAPAATLALTYSFMEERRLDTALSACRHAARSYPDNVINLMTTGRILTAMGRLTEARAAYQRVLEVDSSNQRAHYHLGVVAAIGGDLVTAESEWLLYVSYPQVAPWYRAQAMNRLGMVAERKGDLTTARARWKSAVELAQNAQAKASLLRTDP